MKIKKIIVSQPDPLSEKSPYMELAQKHSLKIDFRPFIQIEGILPKDFRKQRIDILQHTAVLFTSRTAIDHFFRICEEVRITVPETMKYFCISESIAHYLQKYIVYRKRKIFFGPGTFPQLMDVILKHKTEKYLLPLSDVHKLEIPKALDKAKISYTKGIFYRTVSSDLSDLNELDHNMIVFYSPSGIKSLFENFPDFKQNDIALAAFGDNTAKAIKANGLRLDVKAPTPKCPSMTQAIDEYITALNKERK